MLHMLLFFLLGVRFFGFVLVFCLFFNAFSVGLQEKGYLAGVQHPYFGHNTHILKIGTHYNGWFPFGAYSFKDQTWIHHFLRKAKLSALSPQGPRDRLGSLRMRIWCSGWAKPMLRRLETLVATMI